MVKLRHIIALLAVASTAGIASAQWRVVIDPYCISQVAANTASQKAIEDQHNKREFGIRNTIKKLNRQLEKAVDSFGNITDI